MKETLQIWLAQNSVDKRPRTVGFYREIIAIIQANFPIDKTPATVTDQDVIKFAASVAHYCPSRWNQMVSILRQLVPAARILRRRKQRFSEQRPPDKKELAKLLVELDSAHRGHAGLIVRFLAQTGLRIGEARQLLWVDVHSDCLKVPGRVAKNGKPRVIPFIAGLADTLASLRAVSEGAEVLPQADCKTALQRACQRAGIERLSHHDFRHLYATSCIESGVDVPTVARWLGHQDGGALLGKMYFHLLDGHSRRMAARVTVGI